MRNTFDGDQAHGIRDCSDCLDSNGELQPIECRRDQLSWPDTFHQPDYIYECGAYEAVPSMNNFVGVLGSTIGNFSDYIDNRLFADRALAAEAMTAANCGVSGAAAPPDGRCAQAAAQLGAGESSAATAHYGEAINHYKSAWSVVASPSSLN